MIDRARHAASFVVLSVAPAPLALIAAVLMIGCLPVARPAGAPTGAQTPPPGRAPVLTAQPGFATEVRIDRRAVEGGVDFVVTWHNPTRAPAVMGGVTLSGLGVTGTPWWADFHNDGARAPVKKRVSYFTYPHGPNGHYSPLAAFGDGAVSWAVMYLYNPLEDRHDIRGRLKKMPAGEYVFELGFSSAPNAAPMRYPGRLGAGASRTRTLAVRWAGAGAPVAHLVDPYREYYARVHGTTAYVGDHRPVRALAVARVGLLADDNPFGFEKPFRPDVNGWGSWRRYIERVATRWRRVMLWAPTGVYRENRKLNYPYQFTSFWGEGDRWGHRLGDAPQQLAAAVASTGIELGLWWGRSAQIMDGWDTPRFTPFDPKNPEHRARAFKEMDGAVAAGATMVGLDAFTNSGSMPLWEGYGWLLALQERYPGVTFITEKQKPDFIHRIAPTYFFAYNRAAKNVTSIHDAAFLTQRHTLADLLNPGHESWAGVEFTQLRRHLGVKMTPEIRLGEIRRLLDLGYVPVVFGGEVNPGAMAGGRR